MEASVSGLQKHSLADFDQLYLNYHEKLYFFILKYAQSAELAEETVQITFIKIWENADRLTASLPLSIQVYRIAKSTMIDLLRKERVRKKYTVMFAATTDDVQVPVDIDGKEKLAQVNQVISNMAPVRKKVFTLSRIEGHSHNKIASLLSISPRTVENHIAQALRQLRENINSLFFL
jgi:RNA polymerase sigma-70 factor (ECF subfamily)